MPYTRPTFRPKESISKGGIAVTYSIANFPTLRCLEQIRNDVCYHNANVKIVNIGGGVSYGALGVSHHSTEDIAILRALPNMVVVVPCDNIEAEAATRAVFEYEGPVFYRCGYKNEKDIHHTDAKGLNFQLGKAITVEEGSEDFDDDHIAYITAPGTLEGGDVMMVGDHFYVGRSARTNEEGIRQFIEILEGWGLSGSEVPLEYVLHLKTGVNYLEDNNMLVSGEFKTKPDFEKYNKVEIPEDEAYAANCIWVNGTVIVPEGYPTVLKAVQDLGYKTLTVDTSEYRKIDGGLSCLSLRF